MRILALIVLLSSMLQAQTLGDIWRKIPDDVKHHYAGAGTAVVVGVGVHKVFKINPFWCGAIGMGAGWGVTDLKEFWWDGKLGRGSKSQGDRDNGHWGAGCGGFYVAAGYTIKYHKEEERRYLDSMYFDMRAKKDTIK